MRVLIAGGGTGGHVVPAIAIGREMRDRYEAEVCFVGTARGLEVKLVPEAGFALELIEVGQLANVSLKTRVRTMADLPLGVRRCVSLLRSFRPQVVVGVGGYASGPAMMAALLLRIPTLAYEPNAVPGLANRLVGRYVSAAAVNFEQTAGYFRNAEVTGVPVRETIFETPALLASARPRLLITAGSQGAKVFNDLLPQILAELLDAVPGLTVMHQAGSRHVEGTAEAYRASGADAARWEVRAFLDDMAQQYARATLVLARSGSTVAELAAAGRPSLLVPFPQAADNHQRRNAEILQQADAAVMMLQASVTAETLLTKLVMMLQDGDELAAMGARARAMAHPGALLRIGSMVASLAGRA